VDEGEEAFWIVFEAGSDFFEELGQG